MIVRNFTLLTLTFLFFSTCSKTQNGHPATGENTTTTITTSGTTCDAKIANVESMQIFPADNSWNQDISAAPVDPYSNQIIAQIGNSPLHADFGSGLYAGVPIGIPFDVVCGSQPKVKVIFRANAYDGNYGSESDPGPYAIPLNAPIEGHGTGDSHVIVIDKDNAILYELYNASVNSGHWEASSGAIFNLNSDKLRPAGWTSADAAGLPIFPGLVRCNEVLNGSINHCIRFTLSSQNVAPYYISPARHSVNSSGGQYSLPLARK